MMISKEIENIDRIMKIMSKKLNECNCDLFYAVTMFTAINKAIAIFNDMEPKTNFDFESIDYFAQEKVALIATLLLMSAESLIEIGSLEFRLIYGMRYFSWPKNEALFSTTWGHQIKNIKKFPLNTIEKIVTDEFVNYNIQDNIIEDCVYAAKIRFNELPKFSMLRNWEFDILDKEVKSIIANMAVCFVHAVNELMRNNKINPNSFVMPTLSEMFGTSCCTEISKVIEEMRVIKIKNRYISMYQNL